MAGISETEEFEEQVADRDIKMFIDLTIDGFDNNTVSSFSTGNQMWKICTIVWNSGMIRYLEPRFSLSNFTDSNRPLTLLETVYLILSMHKLGSETGSFSYKASNLVLGSYSLIDNGFDRIQSLHHFLLEKVRNMFRGGNNDGEEPGHESEEISIMAMAMEMEIEIEMYAELLRRKSVAGVRRLRRSDEDWEICSAILGSGLMRYLKRSTASPDAPELHQHLPILQIFQLLLMEGQAYLEPQSISYKFRALAITCCSSITDSLARYQELKNSLFETVRQLWLIVTSPLDLLPAFNVPIWH